MHVVVIGCGRVGSDLATQLSEEGNSVVVIDKTRDSFRRLGSGFTGTTIVGSGFDRDILYQAEATTADALAAVTSGDNTNILCARIARNKYQIQNIVARIYDPRRAAIYKKLGIPTVATSTWTTLQVKRWLLPVDEQKVWESETGALQLYECILPDHLAGKPITSLNVGNDIRVVGLIRGEVGRLDTDELYSQEDDVLQFMVTNQGALQLRELLSAGAP